MCDHFSFNKITIFINIVPNKNSLSLSQFEGILEFCRQIVPIWRIPEQMGARSAEKFLNVNIKLYKNIKNWQCATIFPSIKSRFSSTSSLIKILCHCPNLKEFLNFVVRLSQFEEFLNKWARAARKIFEFIIGFSWFSLRNYQQMGARSAENFWIHHWFFVFLRNSLCRENSIPVARQFFV